MEEIIFPQDFEKRMQHQLGMEWAAFKKAHESPTPLSIRINPRKTIHLANQQRTIHDQASPSGVLADCFANAHYDASNKVAWSKYGYYLPKRPRFTLDPTFHAGAYYVQEASSMLLEQVFNQVTIKDEPTRVLDLCAAPGGKSTHVLSLLSPSSLLVSNEVIRSRAAILAENIQKWGYSNVVVTNNDPEDFQRLQGFFDVIIVDAPCSGEGLFRKDPEALQEWSAENANLCSLRQRRILKDLWPALKQDGTLIYSTCTFNPEENERNLQWLRQEIEAEFIELEFDPFWGTTTTSSGYQCFPHKMKGEGFFIAAIRKKGNQPTVRIRSSKNIFNKPSKLSAPFKEWITDKSHHFFQFKDYLLTVPENLLFEIEFLSAQLKIVSAGTTIGTIKHDKLIPDHALALSIYLNKGHFSTIQVMKEEAISYLRKDVFWKEGLTRGFSIVEYEGLALGWVNVLDTRLNNLYPSEWRIRMAADS